jgi:TonB family protein
MEPSRKKPAPGEDAVRPKPGQKGADGVYEAGNGVSPPAILSRRPPEYPDAAIKLRVDGDVLVHAVIEADGTLSGLRVHSPVGFGLERKAMDCVREWRFAPGLKDGKPVPVATSIPVLFNACGQHDRTTWCSGNMEFKVGPSVDPPVVEDGPMPNPAATEASDEILWLEFTVDATGSARNIHRVEGSVFSAQLLRGFLAGWKFRPADDHGRLVEATGRVWFNKGNVPEAAKKLY